MSILKYIVTIEPDDIQCYLMNTNEFDYLKIIKNIDAIKLEKTIHMFHDLNEIIFIFYEKSNELKKMNPNTSTKKIFYNSLGNSKKTIKKRYKD